MKTTSSFDFGILGAGLAGLAMAKAMIEEGASVLLVDTGDIASGASGTPLGLINPATGRYGTKVWNAEKCLSMVAEDLEEVQESVERRFFKNTGILRPAQDEEMAERMFENVNKYDWPSGSCSWLTKKEVMEINPNLHCVEGAMWLPEGLTANVGTYLQAKAALLQQKGLTIRTNSPYEIHSEGEWNRLQFEDGNVLHTKSLIFTSGYETSQSKFWDFLPLHSIKGQVATFESPEADNFDYSLSALGYIASISNSRFVAGSTYEHHFDDLDPDEEGLEYLIDRLSGVYPTLFEKAKVVSQWAGVRASTPNRKPILGQHPERDNLYVYTGLGSKGLMYSVYMAKLLTRHITDSEKLPKELSIDRLH